jgi:hypothetical protein
MTALFKLTPHPDFVLRLSDGCSIPRGHRFWAEYEAWCADGNTPDPANALSLDERKAGKTAALSASIKALEDAQHRATREALNALLAGTPQTEVANSAAGQRLADIDQQIATLRARFAAIDAAPSADALDTIDLSAS